MLGMRQDLVTGEQLGRPPIAGRDWIDSRGRTRKPTLPVAAFDLTFSAPKSVNVAWAMADPVTREAIHAAHLCDRWRRRRHRAGEGDRRRQERRRCQRRDRTPMPRTRLDPFHASSMWSMPGLVGGKRGLGRLSGRRVRRLRVRSDHNLPVPTRVDVHGATVSSVLPGPLRLAPTPCTRSK